MCVCVHTHMCVYYLHFSYNNVIDTCNIISLRNCVNSKFKRSLQFASLLVSVIPSCVNLFMI